MSGRLLQARWIFPVALEPIGHGTIEIAGGRIVAIHRRPPAGAEDLGNVAIVPGLVNAHTHLEFSALPAPLRPAQPFPAWLRTLMAHRRQAGDAGTAIRTGLEECRQAGTVAVGEILTGDWPDTMPTNGVRTVLFRELIGLTAERIENQVDIARRFLDAGSGDSSGDLVRGISPHAPYSVHPALFERLVALAAERQAPLAIHLAETLAELQLLCEGKGELVDFLSDLGLWHEGILPRGRRPLDYLRLLSGLEHVIIAHGNYLAEDEIEFVASRPNFAVAYCPRTHDFFGHAEHPWRQLVARGGLVAIGTDGRCSNPDLSVWNELLFLSARFPATDSALLLRMGTLNGARALGLESTLGTLEPGKSARAAIVQLGDANLSDPYAALFHPGSRVARFLVD